MNKLLRTVVPSLLLAVLGAMALPTHADTSLTKSLPQSIRESGTLRVIAHDVSPPMVFVDQDGHTLKGMEVDLTQAIADALGVKLEIIRGTFDSLIPSIVAGRADLAVGSIGDLKVRQAQVDFVDYIKAGVGMAVLKGNSNGVTDLASLCGKKVAVIRGSFEERELFAQQPKCPSASGTVDVQSFTDPPSVVMSLRSGRADVMTADSAVVGYAVAQSPKTLEVVGNMRPIALLGYAVSKQDTQLRDAVKAALDQLYSNGKYKQILDKWGQGATMVDKITINDAWF